MAKEKKEMPKSIIGEIIPMEVEGVKFGVVERIKTAATTEKFKLGKYNLPQYKALKAAFETHQSICKQLIDLSVEYGGISPSYIAYFAISKQAHRSFVFDNGYKTINVEKARTILNMAKAFCEYNHFKKPSDSLLHAITRYYEHKSTSLDDFNADLNKAARCSSDAFEIVTKALGCNKE